MENSLKNSEVKLENRLENRLENNSESRLQNKSEIKLQNKSQNSLEVHLNDGETMYVNVDCDGWVEIRFSDNMNKIIKANADYFASYYRR